MIITAAKLVAEIMALVSPSHKIFFHLISVSILFISVLYERRTVVNQILPLPYFGKEVCTLNIFLIVVLFPILLIFNTTYNFSSILNIDSQLNHFYFLATS